ncbi:MAG: NADP-dependent oxidoreductase [Acidobacteriota bacterium]
MTEKMNHQWRLAARPVGMLKESDFKWTEEPIPELTEGQVLVHNLYISLDPTNRGWVNDVETYLPPVAIGEVMRSIAIGEVVESRHPGFEEGDIVQGMFGWQEYSVSEGQGLNKIPIIPGLPLTAFFGLFGHIGATAYFGLLDVGKPKAGETLVVSTAAGAVGSLVGQIGKIHGLRVVGLTGSDEKCRWITEELGYDAAINYKTENVVESLKKHCPAGIDIYFENVGGAILDAVLGLINIRARIVVCGLISQYNAAEPVPGPYNFVQILVKRARVEGFVILDYVDRFQEAFQEMGRWYAEGKIKYRVDVVEGLSQAPRAVNKLFDGSNQGKLILKV